jgi:raffinose/stachyose/melibiose transport system substrate-binding protein
MVPQNKMHAKTRAQRSARPLRLWKRIGTLLTACVMCMSAGACGSSSSISVPQKKNLQTVPHVYYLVPDQLAPNASTALSAAIISGLAHDYQGKTGTRVSITIVPREKYESTLSRELTRPAPPTIFQISNPYDEEKWTDYTASLEGTTLAARLTDRRLAVQRGRKISAIPFSQHAYGIAYRISVLQKYFANSDAVVRSIDQVTNFDTLKSLADSIQSHRGDLGIQGAFAPAGWGNTSVQTVASQLTNYPLACEFGNADMTRVSRLNGTCLDGLQELEDMLTSDSTVSANQAARTTVSSAIDSFAHGQSAMIPIDTENESQLQSALQNMHVDENDVGVLPLYVQGVGNVLGDGSHQAQAAQSMTGFAVGANQYWCINKQASKIDQRASQAFLMWVATSAQGQRALQELGLSLPFTAAKGVTSSDLLHAMFDQPVATRVPWLSDQAPSTNWLSNVGSALKTYVQSGGENGGNWASVQSAYVDGWQVERQAQEEDTEE